MSRRIPFERCLRPTFEAPRHEDSPDYVDRDGYEPHEYCEVCGMTIYSCDCEEEE